MRPPTRKYQGYHLLNVALLALAMGGNEAFAQNPKPADMTQSAAAARRFPQPVRAGDLIGRAVLKPTESKPVVGRVTQVVRSDDGTLQVVVAYGGLFGIGVRPIAVPLDTMALLGKDLEILDFTPDQLSAFPLFDGVGTSPVATGDTIRVGLARPSH